MSRRIGFWWMLIAGCWLREVIPAHAVSTDEPADQAFVREVAQGYYDALARKDFQTTAQREIFALGTNTPDLAAYSHAMQQHPYAGADRIDFSITDIDPTRAYLDMKVQVQDGIITERMTWSRTGTPRRWVVQATTMTLAGMPGYEIIPDDYKPPAVKPPRVKSKVVSHDHNPQDGLIAPGHDGPLKFVRPPKVMPAGKIGAVAYVLGKIKNTGSVEIVDIMVRAVVRSDDGSILETKEFRPTQPALAPGASDLFSGTLEHLAPKQTEFSLEWKN